MYVETRFPNRWADMLLLFLLLLLLLLFILFQYVANLSVPTSKEISLTNLGAILG